MTELHDDPFDKKRLAKEAEQEKKAFESRLAAQEEAKRKLARQNLEREKQQLLRAKVAKEGELQKIRSDIAQTNSKKVVAEGNERAGRASFSKTNLSATSDRQINDLKKKIDEGEKEISRLRLVSQTVVEGTEVKVKDVDDKLNILRSELEKVTSEQNSTNEEIKKLTTALEVEKAKEKRLEQEKLEDATEITRLTAKNQEAVAQNKAKEVQNKKVVEKQKEARLELDKLNRNIQNWESELQQVEDQLDSKKKEEGENKEKLEKAGEEVQADKRALNDLETKQISISGELGSVEGKIREIDAKLSQLK